MIIDSNLCCPYASGYEVPPRAWSVYRVHTLTETWLPLSFLEAPQRHCFGLVLPSLQDSQSFHPFFGNGPWTLREAVHNRYPTCGWAPTVSISLWPAGVLVSPSTTLCCTENLLWWGPRAPLIYREWSTWRGQFDAVSVWPNNSSKLTPESLSAPSWVI